MNKFILSILACCTVAYANALASEDHTYLTPPLKASELSETNIRKDKGINNVKGYTDTQGNLWVVNFSYG